MPQRASKTRPDLCLWFDSSALLVNSTMTDDILLCLIHENLKKILGVKFNYWFDKDLLNVYHEYQQKNSEYDGDHAIGDIYVTDDHVKMTLFNGKKNGHYEWEFQSPKFDIDVVANLIKQHTS